VTPTFERLHRRHLLDAFDSDVPVLDTWLKQYAGQSARAGIAVTYVAHVDDVVVGYYALAAGEIAREDAPAALTRRTPPRPIPVIRLARLAVDRSYQGRGLGGGLLREALHGCLNASDVVGARAVIVDAKDDAAAAFYRHFGFTAYPSDPHRLYVTMDVLRASL